MILSRVFIFVFLYGVTTILGAMLTIFWSRFAYRRFHAITHKAEHDRAFVLSTAIALVACGLTAIDGARVYGNLQYGLSAILQRGEAYFIAAGLIVCAFGLFKMVWLADLETQPPRWWWLRWMIGATVLWAIVALLLTPGVPWANG